MVVYSAAGSRTSRPYNLVAACVYPKFSLCRPLLFLKINYLSKGSSIMVVGGSGKGKVSIIVLVTRLVSMLVSILVRIGIRILLIRI